MLLRRLLKSCTSSLSSLRCGSVGMVHSNRRMMTIFLTIFAFWLLVFHLPKQYKIREKRLIIEEQSGCNVADWNRINTDRPPYHEQYKVWADQQVSEFDILRNATARLLSAFVYKDYIAVVMGATNKFNHQVKCRYFDCKRRELPNSEFVSFVFPILSVMCPRRAGAEFISLSFEDDVEEREPIRMVYRAFDKPVHELSVCLGPLYGSESKWLQVAEYVEHYRLMGATFFYFSLFDVNEYDRRIIYDYVRLGIAEITEYQLEYTKPGWQFHRLQTNDCLHRSKYHSKWIVNMDIDERLMYTGEGTFLHYLRSLPPSIGEISLSSNRIRKTEDLPEKYTNEADLMRNLMYLRYNETTEISWYGKKGVLRPELAPALSYHWAWRLLDGAHAMWVPKRIAHFRHYRTTKTGILNSHWEENYSGTFTQTRLNPYFELKLTENVKRRVKYVYDQRLPHCEELANFTKNLSRSLGECTDLNPPA